MPHGHTRRFNTPDQIEHWFSYHNPNDLEDPAAAIDGFERIREAGKYLASTIAARCPECPDTTDAIRKVREAVMTAIAAIACGGR